MQTIFDQLPGEKQRELFRAKVTSVCKAYSSPDENEEEISRAFFRGVQASIDDKPYDWCPDDIPQPSGRNNAFSSGYLFAANVFSSCAVSGDKNLRSY